MRPDRPASLWLSGSGALRSVPTAVPRSDPFSAILGPPPSRRAASSPPRRHGGTRRATPSAPRAPHTSRPHWRRVRQPMAAHGTTAGAGSDQGFDCNGAGGVGRQPPSHASACTLLYLCTASTPPSQLWGSSSEWGGGGEPPVQRLWSAPLPLISGGRWAALLGAAPTVRGGGAGGDRRGGSVGGDCFVGGAAAPNETTHLAAAVGCRPGGCGGGGGHVSDGAAAGECARARGGAHRSRAPRRARRCAFVREQCAQRAQRRPLRPRGGQQRGC